MDTFLSFFISHLPNIIQWIVATIILLIGSLFALMIFGKSKAQNAVETMGSLGDLGDFEVKLSEIVKRNMASTEVSSGTGSTATHGDSQGGSSNVETPKVITSMEKMMQELSLKNAEIEELKQAQAAPKENTADISSYLEKIRDLEGKLAEYEIIEDDIADLSLFKEENMQLKRRLEALGENVSAANPSSLSSSSDQSSKVATSPPEMAHEGVSESSEKSALAESEPPDNTDNINDMLKEATAELTADLDILNQSLHETSTNEGAVASSEKSGVSTGGESARAAQKPAESQEEDILAEFTRSLGHLSQPPSKEREAPDKSALFAEEPKLAEESVSKGEVDTNRMLEEIEGLETLLGEENQDSSLEESVDTDKMAMEASSLVVNE